MFASMVARVSKKSRPHAGAGVPWRGPSRFSGARRSYVYGSYVDELLAILPASGVVGERKFVHANHLYSVAALTDNAGAVVERYRYDAYGQRIVLAGDGVTLRWGTSYGNQVGFTGRYQDRETGLWYFRARYYSGSLGRFVSRDPLEYVDGRSFYAAYYVPNGLDPSGLATKITIFTEPLLGPGDYSTNVLAFLLCDDDFKPGKKCILEERNEVVDASDSAFTFHPG